MAKKKIKDYWFSVLMFVFAGLSMIGMIIISILELDELVYYYSKAATVGCFAMICVFVGLLDLPKKENNDE